MPNGNNLSGSFSSSQAALIVPAPGGGDSLFYLFTPDGFFPEDTPYTGLRYSVINMCAAGGLGDVLPQTKNVLLQDSCLEKIVVVKHANGTDYWVIVHKVFTNNFFSYLISSNGISLGSLSSIGSIHSSYWGTLGQMKISPDGSHLALVCGNGSSLMELFDLDITTGLLSNFINLSPSSCAPYGVSFSPDNTKLYISYSGVAIPYCRISQFDLNAGGGNPDSIRNSETVIFGSANALSQAGMQLGPDGKIYLVPFTSLQHLSVINYPNLKGSACMFADTVISLLGRTVNYTLPGTIDSYNFTNRISPCPTDDISDLQNEFSIQLSPNPVKNTLVVSSWFAINTCEFYNVHGEKINAISQRTANYKQRTEIEVSALTPGMYFVKITTEKGIVVKKFIKVY